MKFACLAYCSMVVPRTRANVVSCSISCCTLPPHPPTRFLVVHIVWRNGTLEVCFDWDSSCQNWKAPSPWMSRSPRVSQMASVCSMTKKFWNVAVALPNLEKFQSDARHLHSRIATFDAIFIARSTLPIFPLVYSFLHDTLIVVVSPGSASVCYFLSLSLSLSYNVCNLASSLVSLNICT